MTSVAIAVQRELTGEISEYLILLCNDAGRWPQGRAETLHGARRRARAVNREFRGRGIRIIDREGEG